nr:hypothetical protein [Mycobacterium leprae]
MEQCGADSRYGALLLVDTWIDLELPWEMLTAMKSIILSLPCADALIIHANGDYMHGNQLLDPIGAKSSPPRTLLTRSHTTGRSRC